MLVNCVAYEQGRKIADISKEAISDYLTRPDCFVWVALHDATPEELEEMIEEYGDSLFAVVQMIDPQDGELNVGEVDIFVGRNYILSVRMRSERGFTAVRARSELEPQLLKHGAAYVFYALIDKVVDRYFPVLDQLETELESIEE